MSRDGAVGVWVREARPANHACHLPTRQFRLRPPGGGALVDGGEAPAGQVGDLYRCLKCGRLWRIADPTPPFGHVGGPRWLRATWWQRLRYLFAGRS